MRTTTRGRRGARDIRWWGLVPTAAIFVLATVSPAAAATAAAPAAGRSGAVYVLQGVPGVTPSVTLDGRVVARDVATKSVIGPLSVAPGTHTVQLWRGDDAVAQAWFTAGAGSSTDLVAHQFPDAKRAPAFTTYENDTSAVPSGRTRLLVAHTAVAPPSDIVVDGRTLVRNLANGEFATNVVPAGAYDVSVVPTVTDGPPILGPTKLTVGPGTLVNVFAIGDPESGGMDAIVHVLPVASTGPAMPTRVETGDGGQAAGLFPENRPAFSGAGPGVAALLVLGGIAGVLRVRRGRA